MRFKKNGEMTTLTGIRSVFWVVGSQEGGGLLLGGGLKADGVTHFSAWQRGGTTYPQGSAAGDSLTHWSQADESVMNATWRLNGEQVARSRGLTGGYDVLSMVVRGQDAATTADGFAFPGEFLTDAGAYCYFCARQRLGEVLIYDRSLSADEVSRVEAYLKAKWGYTQKSCTNEATVNLATGATLQTTGNQYVGTLSGSGTVDGDVTAGTLVAEVGTGPLTVNGTYTIKEGLQIELRGLAHVDGDLKNTIITVLEAGTLAGIENLSTAVFTGDAVPDGYKARLRVADDKILVRFSPRGFVVIMR